MAETISSIVAPASATRPEPCSTRSTLVPISVLISLAASALRPASARTSDATTAKPLPCSPARAASTAALSARMLVWNAIPSMVPMMSAMRRLLSSMPRIVSTKRATTAPPRCATSLAERARRSACCAFSEVCCTVSPSSVIVAAVCSSALACSSVRWLRSLLPMAICALALATDSLPWRTPPTTWRRLSCIACSAAIRLRWSPGRTRMSPLRSPSATCRTSRAASAGSPPSRRRTCSSSSSARPTATSTDTSVSDTLQPCPAA